MTKPMIELGNIFQVSEEEKESIRPDLIKKRGDKYYVEKKTIKFLSDLQLHIAFREKPTPKAFFKAIKEQNELYHSDQFDCELKNSIDELCDQLIIDLGHMKMSDLGKIINLLKLGYNLFASNNQHIFPIMQYGKSHLGIDSDRVQKRSIFNWDESWKYLLELESQGVKPSKYNAGLRKNLI